VNLVPENIDDLHALLGDGKLRQAEIRHVFHYSFHDARTIRPVYLKLHARKLCLVFGEYGR